MNEQPQSFTARYAAALQDHIAHPGEAALDHAHALGRAALGDGLGVLDMAMLHHSVLLDLAAANGAPDFRAQIDKAAEFFAESLSPFEMSFRGYRESNERLTAMNESLQRAKAAAEAANRELEAFSYSVAHDLRAPLRGIDGFSQALLEDCADKLDSEGKLHLRYVRESAQQMAHLIDDLLNLSRVTRGDLSYRQVDLTALVHGTVARLRRTAPDRQVELVVADGVTAEGDTRLLSIVIENLLGNAWKFTGKCAQARIEFGGIAKDGQPVYFVRDNGAGFDMAYAAKLFGVFQRLHSPVEFEGTGIGLATVRRIVGRHGGRVWAEGEIGRGAVFYFTLGARPSPDGKGARP